MAEQAAEPRQRRTLLRTDAEIHDSYGNAIAKKVLEGEAPFQRATSMPSPETPGVKSYSFTTADGVERKTNPQPARVYGTAKGQFLRAYAERHGIENPQFVSRQKATSLLRAAGETGHIKPAAKGAKTIMLPRNSSATNMPVVLEKDGRQRQRQVRVVKGKKGDVSRQAMARPTRGADLRGPAADDHPRSTSGVRRVQGWTVPATRLQTRNLRSLASRLRLPTPFASQSSTCSACATPLLMAWTLSWLHSRTVARSYGPFSILEQVPSVL